MIQEIKRYNFEIELLTPAIVSGADPSIAYLPPNTIRGMLRYWTRALIGGVVGDNKRELKRVEERLWGSTEWGSRILVHLKEHQKNPTSNILDEIRDRPGRFTLNNSLKGIKLTPSHLHFSIDSIQYLLGNLAQNPRMGENPKRNQVFMPGSKWDLTLIFLPPITPKETEIVLWALWFACRLDGIGARKKKGFGSFYLRDKSSHENNVPFSAYIASSGRYEVALVEKISEAVETVGTIINTNRVGKITSYPSFGNDSLTIKVVPLKTSEWKVAIGKLGKAYFFARRTRLNEGNDGKTAEWSYIYPLLRTGRAGGGSNLVNNHLFGLPIPYQSPNVPSTGQLKPRNYSRRDSIVNLTIVRLNQKGKREFCLVMTYLGEEFLPRTNNEIVLDVNNRGFNFRPQGDVIRLMERINEELQQT